MKTAGWDSWTEEHKVDIRIIDFREAFLQGTEPKRITPPDTLRSPETMFISRFDYNLIYGVSVLW